MKFSMSNIPGFVKEFYQAVQEIEERHNISIELGNVDVADDYVATIMKIKDRDEDYNEFKADQDYDENDDNDNQDGRRNSGATGSRNGNSNDNPRNNGGNNSGGNNGNSGNNNGNSGNRGGNSGNQKIDRSHDKNASRQEQVQHYVDQGMDSPSEIAKIIGSNTSYVSRLMHNNDN